MADFSKCQEYVGVGEVADVLGVTKQVVCNWIRRNNIPKPDQNLAMGPVWSTGRLVEWTRLRNEIAGKKQAIELATQELAELNSQLERMNH